jgi:cold shock CspA family protein
MQIGYTQYTHYNSNFIMSTNESASSKYSGRVKWFNNKYGYGFITVLKTDDTESVPVNTDVFAHHSEISVSNDQYRYLVQGEYVAFDVVKTTNGNHEYQCANVKGMYGGQLICETRHEARSQYNKTQSQESNVEASYHGVTENNGNRRFESVRGSQDERPLPRGGRGGRGGRGRF